MDAIFFHFWAVSKFEDGLIRPVLVSMPLEMALEGRPLNLLSALRGGRRRGKSLQFRRISAH